MLVAMDAFAEAVFLAVQLRLVLLGEVAVVLGHVLGFALLKAGFAFFDARGFTCRQLAALDAFGNAVLLALLVVRPTGLFGARSAERV